MYILIYSNFFMFFSLLSVLISPSRTHIFPYHFAVFYDEPMLFAACGSDFYINPTGISRRRLQGNYEADIKIFEKIESEALMMAYYMFCGIINHCS